MTSDHFFIRKNEIDAPSIFLQGEEHHHLARVARVRAGASIWLFDEEGTKYKAEVESVEKERTRLKIVEKSVRQRPPVRLVLAQGLLKSKSMDLVIQKSTELGVHVIIPVVTSRAVVRMDERGGKKVTRWQRIALEAAKQSKSAIVPLVLSPQRLSRLVEERQENLKFYLSENKGRPLREMIMDHYSSAPGVLPPSVMIIVGPEGGWTREEELLLDRSCLAVSLGTLILRAETAAICATAMISQFWGQ